MDWVYKLGNSSELFIAENVKRQIVISLYLCAHFGFMVHFHDNDFPTIVILMYVIQWWECKQRFATLSSES